MKTSTIIRGLGVALIAVAVVGGGIALVQSGTGQKTSKKDGSGNHTTEAPLAKESEAAPESTEELVASALPSADVTVTLAPSATPEAPVTSGPSVTARPSGDSQTAAPGTDGSSQSSNNNTDAGSQPGNNSTASNGNEGSSTSTAAPAQKVAFEIKKGDDSETVSQKLEEAGIVDDADAFNMYLEQGGYSNRLIAGSYKLTPGDTYSTLAKTLAGQSK